MSKQSEAHTTPEEELLGQSTPYNLKRIIAFYILLIVAVLITAALFTLRGVMDALQIVLTAITLACAAVGLGRLLHLSRQPVYLYDTYFQVGGDRYPYESVSNIECSLQQVRFRTGEGKKDHHAFLAGNAEALAYLIRRRQTELRKARGSGKKQG